MKKLLLLLSILLTTSCATNCIKSRSVSYVTKSIKGEVVYSDLDILIIKNDEKTLQIRYADTVLTGHQHIVYKSQIKSNGEVLQNDFISVITKPNLKLKNN